MMWASTPIESCGRWEINGYGGGIFSRLFFYCVLPSIHLFSYMRATLLNRLGLLDLLAMILPPNHLDIIENSQCGGLGLESEKLNIPVLCARLDIRVYKISGFALFIFLCAPSLPTLCLFSLPF